MRQRLHESLRRLKQGLSDTLLRRVSWRASEQRDLSAQPGDRFPLVIVLGREHYSERRESYPALRRRDLEQVLRGDLTGEPPTITLIGPVRDDRREVSFYRLDRHLVESLPRSLFIVPEGVLLAVRLAEGSWAEVERQGYRYFLFSDGRSQPAGGTLEARSMVAFAAGVDPDKAPEEWHGSGEIAGYLRQALPALPLSDWWSCRNPLPRAFDIAGIAWRPIGLAAALALFGYLTLSSVYLQAMLSYREAVLGAQGPEVQQGLVAVNQSRAYAAQRDALIELWSARADTQQLWGAVASTMQNDASVSGIEIQDDRISLRGDARDASQVFSALAALPQFRDVTFDAPVRSGRGGRQNFALSLSLAGAPSAAENAGE